MALGGRAPRGKPIPGLLRKAVLHGSELASDPGSIGCQGLGPLQIGPGMFHFSEFAIHTPEIPEGLWILTEPGDRLIECSVSIPLLESRFAQTLGTVGRAHQRFFTLIRESPALWARILPPLNPRFGERQ